MLEEVLIMLKLMVQDNSIDHKTSQLMIWVRQSVLGHF